MLREHDISLLVKHAYMTYTVGICIFPKNIIVRVVIKITTNVICYAQANKQNCYETILSQRAVYKVKCYVT